MKFLKWSLFFVFSFLVAWIIIFTFIQEPFRQVVPAQILAYQSPPFPIYLYIAFAFFFGLGIGLVVSFYQYVTLSAAVRREQRQMETLEEEYQALQRKCEPGVEVAPREETANYPAPKEASDAPSLQERLATSREQNDDFFDREDDDSPGDEDEDALDEEDSPDEEDRSR
jgi:hypothetical protein